MSEETRSQRREAIPDKKTVKKEKKARKKQQKKNRKWYIKYPLNVAKFLLWSLFTLLIVSGLAASVFWHINGDEISNNITEGYGISKTISSEQFAVLEPTKIYDKDGNLIKELKERNFQYLSLKDDDALFEKVSDVVVSIEDERFFDHKGFDYYGVGISAVNYIRGGDLRGASTITQQLVKNTYLSQEQSISRKIKEAVISQELEKAFTKREILEFYVNDNYYGNGQYGLETAARYYYGKTVAELSVGELAVLTGIPNNPTIYDPIQNPENALNKRNVILAKMLELDQLDKETYDSETAKPLELSITPTNVDNTVTAYDQSFALFNAVEEVMKHNGFRFVYWFENNEDLAVYTSDYDNVFLQTREDILKGGYAIETSIDSEKQATLQQAVDSSLSGYYGTNSETGLYSKQASATTIDNQTGEVVAIVGGRSQDGNTYNRAYLGARQPGSAMKPFLAYAPAYEIGYLPQSIIEDKAIKNGPKNWYPGYWGNMEVRYALEQSVNTVAYRLMSKSGTMKVMNKLADMEFRTLRPEDNNAITAVGGFTVGVTTAEMSSAMATLVNNGEYVPATNVRKVIKTTTNEVIFEKENERKKQVYDDGASYLTLDTMKGVIDSGTGKAADWGYKHLAGKTGTTDDSKDLWFVGATPYYSTSVWLGDDIPKKQAGIGSITKDIFKKSMKAYHNGKEVIDFKMPNSVTRKGTNLYNNLYENNEKQASRLSEEETRKANENQNQRIRLEAYDYRIIHGLTKAEEDSRERIAKAKIQLLNDFELTIPKDFDKTEPLYKDAYEALEEVKHQVAYNQLFSELETAYQNKRNEKAQLEYVITVEKQRAIDEALAKQQAKEQAEFEKEQLKKEKIEEELERQNALDEERIEKELSEQNKEIEEERVLEEQRKQEEEQKQEEEDSTSDITDSSLTEDNESEMDSSITESTEDSSIMTE